MQYLLDKRSELLSCSSSCFFFTSIIYVYLSQLDLLSSFWDHKHPSPFAFFPLSCQPLPWPSFLPSEVKHISCALSSSSTSSLRLQLYQFRWTTMWYGFLCLLCFHVSFQLLLRFRRTFLYAQIWCCCAWKTLPFVVLFSISCTFM